MVDWTKEKPEKIERRTKKLIKTLGRLYPCSNIDGNVLGRTEVNLLRRGKLKTETAK